MKRYVVSYQAMPALGAMWLRPVWFRCEARDENHAREQCNKVYPGCHVVKVALEDSSEGGG